MTENCSNFPHLMKPMILRGQFIRNRVISAPQNGGPNILEKGPDGFDHFTEAAAFYYGAIARGGAGIVTTSECGVDPRYSVSTNHFDFSEKSLKTMHLVSDAVRGFGAVAALELSHAGKVAEPAVPGVEPMGPSECVMKNAAHFDQLANGDDSDKVHVREMTPQDMEDVAEYFAAAALMAKRGGFNMVVVHCGHGWLLHQFLSPHENHRTDEYGGSIENRVKFPKMVLERIRQRIGRDMILEIRFSVNEFVDDGLSIEEAVRTAELLQDSVDIIQCSVGIRSGLHSLVITHPTFFLKDACNSYLAREMKKHVHIPVDAVGAINDPYLAEQLLAEGACDFVAMARSHIADPDWALKVREGRPEDIRPCIRCLRCLYSTPVGHSRCTVNPSNNWEFIRRAMERPASGAKKVLVAGGGPAGMQAALTAAERGHEVVLFEKNDELGGQVRHAKYVNFKELLEKYRQYLITQVEKNPRITVRCGTALTPEMAKEEKADAVIVALGAREAVPPVEGLSGEHVMTALEAFSHPEKVGEKVLVLGGGSVGCEAALHFKNLGKQVTVVEAIGKLMSNEKDPHIVYHNLLYFDHVYDRDTAQLDQAPLRDDPVRVMLNTLCIRVEPGCATVKHKGGEEETIEADTIIVATGMRPRAEERDAFLGCAELVIPVGDCLLPATIQQATRAAYAAAVQI